MDGRSKLGHKLVSIDQSVFGYDRGHRLLVTSWDYPSNVSSLLLVLSDLAPGVTLNPGASYWTGVPLPDTRRFALLKTWPAPEMPRPGCVWTHALFVSFADLGRLEDLRFLARMAIRPSALSNLEVFSRTLELVVDDTRIVSDERDTSSDHHELIRLLHDVYRTSSPKIVKDLEIDPEDCVFPIWSQQWPRLRRSFSFRTSTLTLQMPNRNTNFMLGIAPKSDQRTLSPSPTYHHPTNWEILAAEDLQSPAPTDFRRFLWHYGSDIPQGRRHYWHLSQLYEDARLDRLSGMQLTQVFQNVVTFFPEPKSALRLKSDLVSSVNTYHGLFPPRDPIGIVLFCVRNQSSDSLPDLPSDTINDIWQSWPAQSDSILDLIEVALNHGSPLAESLVARLVLVGANGDLLGLTRNFPAVRRSVVQKDPDLLDSDALLKLNSSEIVELIESIPVDAPVHYRLTDRLISSGNLSLGRVVFDRNPSMALESLVNNIEDVALSDEALPLSLWRSLLADHESTFLHRESIERSRSTRGLFVYAFMLRYFDRDVLPSDPHPWIVALGKAKDNVSGKERQLFLSFLLGVGLRAARPGCEVLFERSFSSVHRDLELSRLPAEAFDLFAGHLSEVPRWQEWDVCLRLRLSVVDAYAESKLDPQSFVRLGDDAHLVDALIGAASTSRRGRKLLKKAQISDSDN